QSIPVDLYTLSLHDALPIYAHFSLTFRVGDGLGVNRSLGGSGEPRSKLHSWYLGTVAGDGEAHDHGVVLIDRARVNPTEDQNRLDRKSTRLNSSHEWISYAV